MEIISRLTLALSTFIFSLSIVSAQPISFTINCPTGGTVNGDYVRSNRDRKTCPCYDKVGDTRSITRNGASWLAVSGGTCESLGAVASSLFSVGAGPDLCFIDRSVNDSCNPATALSNVVYPSENIPTLSQWSLIILGLIFLIVGTIAVKEPIKQLT